MRKFARAFGAQLEVLHVVQNMQVHGINFFDTADNYTEGESETILGQSLKNLNIARKDVVIATKVYNRVGPGRNCDYYGFPYARY